MNHVYKCPNKRCREYGNDQIKAMLPSEYRAATGSSVRCNKCGGILVYKGANHER